MITSTAWEEVGQYETLLGYQIYCIDTEHDADHDAGRDTDDGTAHRSADAARPPEKTVLLIHGFPTSSWDWVKIWAPLSAEYRLIALDMLGFGYSDKPVPHPYSIHEQADIVEAAVRHFGIQNFHVLAHDYGDTVAQELLARQNEGGGAGHWRSVCFLNGGLFPETHKALLIQRLLVSPLGPLVNRLTTRHRFDSSMRRCFGPKTPPSAGELDGFWDLVNHKGGRHIFHNLITYMRDRKTFRTRWLRALREAEIPVGLINGSFDPISGAHMIARFKEVVGDPAFLVELPEIGHYPHLEDPDTVAQSYLGFIAGISS